MQRSGGWMRSGLTLLELMATVAIVGILSGIGVVSYQRVVERSYLQEADDLLMTIYYGEQAYRAINNTFYQPGAWTTIYMEDPNIGSIPVTFAVNAADATTFTATATRTDGPCDGLTQTINQTRTLGGTWPACPSL